MREFIENEALRRLKTEVTSENALELINLLETNLINQEKEIKRLQEIITSRNTIIAHLKKERGN